MLSAPPGALPKARIAMIRASGALPISRRMGGDRAGNAGAVDMRPFLAAKRIKAVGDRVGQFGMVGVDAGIDHGDRDVHAVRERVRLRQPKLRQRILRGIALGRRGLLVLQPITEIELHRAHAAIGGKFTAHGRRPDGGR